MQCDCAQLVLKCPNPWSEASRPNMVPGGLTSTQSCTEAWQPPHGMHPVKYTELLTPPTNRHKHTFPENFRHGSQGHKLTRTRMHVSYTDLELV